jgi:hypothetical protein
VLYLDDWRPGAESLFRLDGLMKLGVQRFGRRDLSDMSGWGSLRELWLNAGPLEQLTGVPRTVAKLRLTGLRRLVSLEPLGNCPDLEDLRLAKCPGIRRLNGVEPCLRLDTLSASRCGPIESLEPLRGHDRLRYLVLADGSIGEATDISAIYSLSGLETLIIPRSSGVSPEEMSRRAPRCGVRLTKG